MDWGSIGYFLIFGLVMFVMHRNGGGCCGGGGHGQYDGHNTGGHSGHSMGGGCCGGSGAQTNNEENHHDRAQTIDTQQVVIEVTGMTCGHCIQTIEKALFALRGVVSVGVSLEINSVKVIYDPTRTTVLELKDAIRNAGYNSR